MRSDKQILSDICPFDGFILGHNPSLNRLGAEWTTLEFVLVRKMSISLSFQRNCRKSEEFDIPNSSNLWSPSRWDENPGFDFWASTEKKVGSSRKIRENSSNWGEISVKEIMVKKNITFFRSSEKLCFTTGNNGNSLSHIFGKNFVKVTDLLTQCGNCRNSLSHFFRKNFVKAMVLLKKLLNISFDKIFFQWERIARFSTLYSCNFYTVQFLLLNES